MSSDSPPPEPAALASEHRRPFLPRFGLRSLFVFALLLCLLFGWIGKGFYRVRQEDAAIEAILQSGGGLYTGLERGLYGAPGPLPEPGSLPILERVSDLLLRSVGCRQRPAVAKIELRMFDAGDPAAEATMSALALFPEVRSVSLMGPAFDDASLRTLDRLPKLEELYLLRTRATADGLSKIASPERLRYLHVQEHGPWANVLAGAGALRGLREADVINCLITRDDVVALASLPELETLSLREVQPIGDEVLTPLAEARKLQTLDLWIARRRVIKEELKAVAAAPALERLEISCDESDLAELLAARKLRFLRAFPVSEDAARAFSLERPECVIQFQSSSETHLRFLKNGKSLD